jgi:predicted ribosome quality control (RQC) complex YloA/Tae2 family protein
MNGGFWLQVGETQVHIGTEDGFDRNNAIKYTEELKKAGFSPDQADVSMKVLIDVMNENFATKLDIHELKNELNAKIDLAVEKLDQKIDSLGQKMESGFREMEYKMTLKLGTIGVTATVLKLIQSGH